MVVIILGGLAWYFFIKTPILPGEAETGTNFQNLFPFGKNPTPKPDTTGGLATDNNPIVTEPTIVDDSIVPRLRQIFKEPNAGSTFVITATTSLVRFVERATGHIYDAPVSSNRVTKISNVTIPKVHEAIFSGDGSRIILRYIQGDDQPIKSFYAKISTTSVPEKAIEGAFLADGIKDITVFGNKIFYIDATTNGGQAVVANMDGSGKATLFSNAFTDWAISWNNAKTAFLYSKPSGVVSGSGYMIDMQKGGMTKINGNYLGLEGSLSPAGNYIFLSATDGSNVASASYSVASGTPSVLSLRTLVNKCVWSNTEKDVIYCAVPTTILSGTYPDDWYKGVATFNDLLWRIDMKSGATDVVLDGSVNGADTIDMTNLKLDSTDSHITFTNKKDQSLWIYRIKE